MTELASPADRTLLALADNLVERAGRGHAKALSRLDGGKNNQVYRVATDAGDAVVLKNYFSDPRDPRDRLAAEWGFLRHTWFRGVHVVPEPLASDETARAGLYGFVPGRKLLASELKPPHIDAAIDFVLAVNAAPRTPHRISRLATRASPFHKREAAVTVWPAHRSSPAAERGSTIRGYRD